MLGQHATIIFPLFDPGLGDARLHVLAVVVADVPHGRRDVKPTCPQHQVVGELNAKLEALELALVGSDDDLGQRAPTFVLQVHQKVGDYFAIAPIAWFRELPVAGNALGTQEPHETATFIVGMRGFARNADQTAEQEGQPPVDPQTSSPLCLIGRLNLCPGCNFISHGRRSTCDIQTGPVPSR